jgi:hypothetical protein
MTTEGDRYRAASGWELKMPNKPSLSCPIAAASDRLRPIATVIDLTKRSENDPMLNRRIVELTGAPRIG